MLTFHRKRPLQTLKHDHRRPARPTIHNLGTRQRRILPGNPKTVRLMASGAVGGKDLLAFLRWGKFGGLFSAIGGLGLTMTTGIGSPHAGVLYTLSGLAAVVIGGVSLTGGRGGVVGPVIAAFVLTLIPADLIFLNIDPNFGQVIQGTLIVLVVMAGGLATIVRDRR